MNQFRRMVIINIITLIVLVGGGIGGYYYYNQAENYLKTDNAKIDGKVIPIASPVAGKLTDWKAEVGKNYNENDKLGAVTVAAANGEQTVDVTIPQNATVVQSNATTNAFVGAGSPIAYAFDMNNLWVTANIEETDVDDVQKRSRRRCVCRCIPRYNVIRKSRASWINNSEHILYVTIKQRNSELYESNTSSTS